MRIEDTCPECGAPAYLAETDGQLQFECSDLGECGHVWVPRGRALALRTLGRPKAKINGRNKEYFSPLLPKALPVS